MWVARLTPASVEKTAVSKVLTERRWEQNLDVAKSWHIGRLMWAMGEMHATAHGMDQDRVAELLGCMDSTSERFGLALAAGNEVAIWQHVRDGAPQDRWAHGQIEMSQRAMAELFGYYLLGTGHMLASIVLRSLALERALRPVLLDLLGASCVVHSVAGPDWPSLNVDTCRKLRKVARNSGHPALHALVGPITTIVQSQAWTKLDELRGEDYHRRRPSSAPLDGAPLGSAWRLGPDGRTRSLMIGTSRPTDNDQRATEMSTVMFGVEALLLATLPQLRTGIQTAFDTLFPATVPEPSRP